MTSLRDAIPDACPLKPRYQSVPGRCGRVVCDKELPKGRRRWCSDKCASGNDFFRQYHFPTAREAALHRDGHRCVRCKSKGEPPKELLRQYKARRPIDPEGRPGADAPFDVRMAWTRTDASLAWNRELQTYYAEGDALHRRFQLEVNHIRAAEGAHAQVSCIHHLDNLETLCGPCHRETTAQQARERADRRNRRIPLLEVAS
jgi:5-methylcytosine-specific restriction endonuclease McrA